MKLFNIYVNEEVTLETNNPIKALITIIRLFLDGGKLTRFKF